MKLKFIFILFLLNFAPYSISQIEESTIQNIENPVITNEVLTNSGSIDREIARNPAMDLIEKNGGLVFAEITSIGNLTHIFTGKENNSDFEKAIEIVKSKEFIQSFIKINSSEYQVEFVHGVTDNQQRLFYELLGFSGYLFKQK